MGTTFERSSAPARRTGPRHGVRLVISDDHRGLVKADQSSMSEVRALVALEVERGEAIDVLFHVAGVMQQSATRRLTVDGHEETLAVDVRARCLPL